MAGDSLCGRRCGWTRSTSDPSLLRGFTLKGNVSLRLRDTKDREQEKWVGKRGMERVKWTESRAVVTCYLSQSVFVCLLWLCFLNMSLPLSIQKGPRKPFNFGFVSRAVHVHVHHNKGPIEPGWIVYVCKQNCIKGTSTAKTIMSFPVCMFQSMLWFTLTWLK